MVIILSINSIFALMYHKLKDRTTFIFRHLFSIAAITILLLSSCYIQSEIKNVLGIPTTIQHSGNKKINVFSIAVYDACSHSVTSDLSQAPTQSSFTNNLLAVATLSAIVMLLFSVSEKEKNKHPFYNTFKICDPLPIFLLYRKLII
ncbi:hypothetical protein [Flavobacterium frigidarium]|jgi:hypothetical protein|uniref:Uncharacterized protein n=1 Tax=Flavobacterium frigidarium TaxID=99286 RepID=A0ABV4KJM4_9FLAO